jgi:hypothetical protein
MVVRSWKSVEVLAINPRSGRSVLHPYKLCAHGLEVEGALFLQQREVAENVLFDFSWFRF